MTITLRDLAALTGLFPCADTVSCAMEYAHTPPVFESHTFSSYNAILAAHKKTGPVIDETERVAFVHYALCRYILCTGSGKPVPSYLNLSTELANRRKLDLAYHVLAALYHGLSLVGELLKLGKEPTGVGPLWIAQLWLQTYFPFLGTSPASPSSLCFGPRITALPPVTTSPGETWNYLKSEEPLETFFPFPLSENPATLYTVSVPLWRFFLVCQEMPFDIILGSNAKDGAETYSPNFVTRQFELTQAQPLPLFFARTFGTVRFGILNLAETKVLLVNRQVLLVRFKAILFVPQWNSGVDDLFPAYWDVEIGCILSFTHLRDWTQLICKGIRLKPSRSKCAVEGEPSRTKAPKLKKKKEVPLHLPKLQIARDLRAPTPDAPDEVPR